jgi:hypothetical protein
LNVYELAEELAMLQLLFSIEVNGQINIIDPTVVSLEYIYGYILKTKIKEPFLL